MDLDSFLAEIYVIIDDWWQGQPEAHPPQVGRPARLSPSEVLTVAMLGQWPRWRNEGECWRLAGAHLRPAFPQLCSQSPLNRRERAAEPPLRRLHAALAEALASRAAVYHFLDTTLIPVIRRVRASRHGLFADEASFGRCVSKREWVYGFKVALAVAPPGIITAFGLAPANGDERPIAEALIAADRYPAYLTDKGFASVPWERHWQATDGTVVAATPMTTTTRAWPEEDCRWVAGKRQVIDQVIAQLKDFSAVGRQRAETVGGLLSRLAAKVVAFTAAQMLNHLHGRLLRHLVDLLV